MAGASVLALCAPARAQQAPTSEVSAPPGAEAEVESRAAVEDGTNPEIVVTGQRPRGAVDTEVPVEQELDEADIASYGAASIGELLTALAPQTGSARGRGGGRPVVLINGQRVSGFRELVDLPPEAIERVQIFPEELALQYGFRPDQRVVNFILKPNYRSLAVDVGYGFATNGDYETNEIDATLTRIGRTERLNLNAEFEPTSRLLQSDRDIIQSRTDALGLVDQGRFRTLLPDTDPLQLSASLSRNIGDRTSLSLTAAYDRTRTLSLLGLPALTATVPGTSPFSRTGADERVTRLFPEGGGLERQGQSDVLALGANANGQIGDWRWTANTTYNRSLNRSDTERQADASALVAGVAAGTVNPFAPDLALSGPRSRDTTRSLIQNGTGTLTATGSPVRLPAGEAQLTLTALGSALGQDSRSTGRVVSAVSLDRQSATARANLVLPVTSVREGFGEAIGTLSVNGNYGATTLSDFGSLTEYGYGLTWEPIENFTLQASVIGQQAAPGLNELGAPTQITPNVPVFDGTTGGTVFADVLTGGNSDLRRERQRDQKVSLTWNPGGGGGGGGRRGGGGGSASVVVEYLVNRSRDVTAGFPLLTRATEAAFPDRVTRDAGGRLTQLDLRPVTFDRLRSSRLRFGFTLNGTIGPEPQRGGPPDGTRGGGRPAAAGELPQRPSDTLARREPQPTGGESPAGSSRPGTGSPSGERGTPTAPGTSGSAPAPTREGETAPAPSPPPVARPSPAGVFFGGRGGQGRWFLALYDTWQFDNRVLIRPGVPELDLLGGDVTDGSTPIARHQAQLEGGVFKDGLGLRLSGTYTSRAVLSDGGTGLTGGTASDLAFGDIATLSVRAFIDFDQREDALKALPVLKGGRLSLRVDNLFGGVRPVRDQFGATPLAYQPGFLDPRGRYVEVSFRKRF